MNSRRQILRRLVATTALMASARIAAADQKGSQRPGELTHDESLEARVARLEAEVAALQAEAADLKCKETLREMFAPIANARVA